MRTRRVLVSTVVVLLVGMGMGVRATPVGAATVGVTVAGGTVAGSTASQLSGATAVALDRSGNLYVADRGNNRVQRWAPGAASGVTVAGGNGAGSAADQLSDIWGVAVDRTGNVYVSDYVNNRVQRWAPGAAAGVTVAGGNGNGSAANQFGGPLGVTLDGSGNLYVADVFNNRVQRWAPGATAGVTVAGGHGRGSGDDQFYDGPFGVALDGSGNLYVGDSGNDRVMRWAPGATSGVQIAGFGFGPASNGLDMPRGVAVDAAGNVYVADYGNLRVQRWAPGATSGVTAAGGNESGPAASRLGSVSGLAVDDHGQLYVADGSRVQRWPADGQAAPTVLPDRPTWYLGEGDSGTTSVNMPVYLSQPSTETVTVQWTTLHASGAPGDQADPATDYVPSSGVVTFAPGETAKAVPIVVRGDRLTEPDEYLLVSFHDPTNALMGGPWGLAFIVILNDDPPPTVLPSHASAPEGSSGGTSLRVPVTLSNPSAVPVTVCWTTLHASGAPGDQADPATDYVPASGIVTFAPGETSRAVTVVVRGDTVVEPDEYVAVSFRDPTNAVMGGFWGLGFGVITNDD